MPQQPDPREPAPAQPMTDKPTSDPGPGADPAAPAHDDWLLDESLRETFPASDPISPVADKPRRQGSTHRQEAAMNDKSILDHISSLIEEEHRLRGADAPAPDPQRLKHVEEELDQCWDLLRQRRAKREFGEDPDAAAPRDIGTVENYQG